MLAYITDVFGPESFVTSIKEKYYFKKKTYELPELKNLAPTSELIISTVCDYYKVSFNDLLKTRRGSFNEPRNIAIYLIRYIRGENLNNIGELFNIKRYSTVSSIIQRVGSLRKKDKKFRRHIEIIENKLYKGQK